MDKSRVPKTYTDIRIIQIIPAVGWCAVFRDKGRLDTEPLVCFALIAEGNTLSTSHAMNDDREFRQELIVGYSAGMEAIIEMSAESINFVGYLAPGEDANDKFGDK